MANAALKAMQKIMDKACRAGLQGASLAVFTDGRMHTLAAGMANVPEDVPTTTDTLFHIGSATKAITAEMIWRLVGEGKLAADMPVIEALPEIAHLSALADRRLTLAHLLSHTGGL